MSFGLEANNEFQRRVLDDNHGLYSVAKANVFKDWKEWKEGAWVFERVGIRFTYMAPYTSDSPPMIFMQGNGDHPSVSNPYYWDYYLYRTWYNDIRYEHYGSPGNWTGVYIGIIIQRPYFQTTPVSKTWDMRRSFLVAGEGTGQLTENYGLAIYDDKQRVVFNSNDNFVKVTGYSNDWRYNYREQLGDEYVEVHTLHGAPVPTDRYNEWISLIPFGMYRRYNGETAQLWTCNLTRGQNPQVCVKGGRSGSQFHAPVYKIRTTRPPENVYI